MSLIHFKCSGKWILYDTLQIIEKSDKIAKSAVAPFLEPPLPLLDPRHYGDLPLLLQWERRTVIFIPVWPRLRIALGREEGLVLLQTLEPRLGLPTRFEVEVLHHVVPDRFGNWGQGRPLILWLTVDKLTYTGLGAFGWGRDSSGLGRRGPRSDVPGRIDPSLGK